MRPYSLDFRQKIIEVYEQEKISIRNLAQRFRVAKSNGAKITKTISTFQEILNQNVKEEIHRPKSKEQT